MEVQPGMTEDDLRWNPPPQVDENVPLGAGTTEWTVMVVNDPKTVNAMAAYGNIVVFTGLLPVAKDEDGLASIIGHGTCSISEIYEKIKHRAQKLATLVSSLPIPSVSWFLICVQLPATLPNDTRS